MKIQSQLMETLTQNMVRSAISTFTSTKLGSMNLQVQHKLCSWTLASTMNSKMSFRLNCNHRWMLLMQVMLIMQQMIGQLGSTQMKMKCRMKMKAKIRMRKWFSSKRSPLINLGRQPNT